MVQTSACVVNVTTLKQVQPALQEYDVTLVCDNRIETQHRCNRGNNAELGIKHCAVLPYRKVASFRKWYDVQPLDLFRLGYMRRKVWVQVDIKVWSPEGPHAFTNL